MLIPWYHIFDLRLEEHLMYVGPNLNCEHTIVLRLPRPDFNLRFQELLYMDVGLSDLFEIQNPATRSLRSAEILICDFEL